MPPSTCAGAWVNALLSTEKSALEKRIPLNNGTETCGRQFLFAAGCACQGGEGQPLTGGAALQNDALGVGVWPVGVRTDQLPLIAQPFQRQADTATTDSDIRHVA